MASPNMIAIEMRKQLLRKQGVKSVTPVSSDPNRATRRKMDQIASHIDVKQGLALLKVAEARGLVPKGTHAKALESEGMDSRAASTMDLGHVTLARNKTRAGSLLSRCVLFVYSIYLWTKSSLESFTSRSR